MEQLQARVKLDRFIRVRTGKASIQLSQFLSKIGKDESWLAGIKKGTTCVDPATFKPALKYLKIKHGSQEYYEFGCYVYTILDDAEKEKFSELYSKKDVADMLAKCSKTHKAVPEKSEPEIENEAEKPKKEFHTGSYETLDNELYTVINNRVKSLNMTWTDLETLIGTKLNRVKSVGQFSAKYLKDLLDALNIKHDSDDARNIVELAKKNFSLKAKKDKFDIEYNRILDNDIQYAAKEEVPVEKEEVKVEEPKAKEPEPEIENLKQKVQTSSLYGSICKKPSNKSAAKKEFGKYLSYIIVIKGLSLYSFSQMIDDTEENIKAVIEGYSTFDIFQAMRIPDLLELNSADTREFKHKYMATIAGNSEIEFPEYVAKYLNNHLAAVMAIAKAADINADDTYWNDMYDKLISDSQ